MLKKIITAPQVLLFIAACCWGGNAVASKLAVGNITPMMLTFSRWVIAVAVLIFLGRKHIAKDWPLIKRNLPYLIGMGCLGFSLFNATMYSAAQFIPAIHVAIEQAAVPLIIFIINLIMFKKPIRMLHLIGYSITTIGVMLTISKGNLLSLNMQTLNFGDLLMLIACCIYALYTVLLFKKPTMHWMSLTAVLATGGLIGGSILLIGELSLGVNSFDITWKGVGVILFAAIFPSIIAQAAYIEGNAKLGANVAGLFINLVPVLGVLLAVVTLGEQLHFYHAISLVLVLGGIFVAQRAKVN
jgi:drug/metabolite transporter (DMT)-like permease